METLKSIIELLGEQKIETETRGGNPHNWSQTWPPKAFQNVAL
jgi:hypothetical protein